MDSPTNAKLRERIALLRSLRIPSCGRCGVALEYSIKSRHSPTGSVIGYDEYHTCPKCHLQWEI
jgi:hypothetical protein